MKKLFFLLIIFSIAGCTYDMSKTQQIPNQIAEKVFLQESSNIKEFSVWRIKRYLNDEKGYSSIQKLSDESNTIFKALKNDSTFGKVEILLNKSSYVVEDNVLCRDTNNAYQTIVKKIGKENVFCLRSTQMLPMQMLLIGESNIAKVQAILSKKQKSHYPDGRSIKYKIEDETI